MKILFTADLHGNVLQVETLVKFAIEQQPDLLLIAGDLFPKLSVLPKYNSYARKVLTTPPEYKKSIAGQFRLFRDALFPRLLPFLEECSDSRIFICFGNADIWALESRLQEFLSDPDCVDPSISSRFRVVLNDTFSLDPFPLDLMTFSFIPFKWTRLVDWQRFDRGPLCQGEEFEAKLAKYVSWTSLGSDRLEEYGLELVEDRPDTFGFPCVRIPLEARLRNFTLAHEIETILEKRPGDADSRNPTLVMSHCPPAGTLNSIEPPKEQECGAFSYRVDFLEREDVVRDHKLVLFLCGHVHGAPDAHRESNRDFFETGVGSVIGGVPIVSAGNSPLADKLSAIVIDLELADDHQVTINSMRRHMVLSERPTEEDEDEGEEERATGESEDRQPKS